MGWIPSGGSGTSLTVAESDGTPSVSGVSTILVSNTTLTDNTGGSVTIAMTPAGGANTALSNLAAVAINAAVSPGADNTIVHGTTALRFSNFISGGAFSIYKAASEANPTATLGNGVLNFGAGTTNAVDVGLKRSSGGVLYVTDGSSGAGDLNTHGLVIADTTMVTNLNADTVDGSHAAAFANVALSNLAGVAINTSLVPGSEGTLNVGASDNRFLSFYAKGVYCCFASAADEEPLATFGNYGGTAAIKIGPGGSTATDTGLTRASAGLLKVTDSSTGSGHIAASSLTRVAPTTDAAPSSTLVKSADSFPGATGGTNTVGANTILAGGIGQRIFTVVAYDNGTVPLSTVTITVNGTATVKTEGTDWFDTTGNNEMATSLATAIDGITGVSATASSAVVRIVPDVGTYSLTIAKTAADAGMTATSGTNGAVGAQDQLTILNAGGNIILDTNGATGFRIRNAANDGYASSVSMGTAYVWGGNNINLINDASVVALGGSLGVGITYSAPGVMAVCNGSSSNSLGSVIASTAITAVGTAAANGYIRTGVYKRAWTNAEVTAFGAVLSGDLKVATLPAKTVIRNAYVVIDSQAAGTTTLTAAMGRTSAAYIDYIVASNAKVAANTVYGDAVAERGTNLTGYDLASYTATTDVYVQFVSTVENLSAVTSCTGTIYLLTEVLP